MSARIFQYCIWEELETEFTKYGLMRKDLKFIQQLIDHDKNFKDVEPQKRYLFEVRRSCSMGPGIYIYTYMLYTLKPGTIYINVFGAYMYNIMQ